MNYCECFGHAASILTAIAYLVKDILWLRILTVLACVSGILFNYFVPSSPLWTVIGWNIVFLAINAVQIVLIVRERSSVNFTEEEQELYETLFHSFAPFEFMKLLRAGAWGDAKVGETLATENQPIDRVMLIYSGRAVVENQDKRVAELRDGNFIGEISFIRGGNATATVRAAEPTRYLAWSKDNLRKLLNRNPSLRSAMQAVLSTDLTKKLVRAK
jgi:hypothetical protein